MSALVEAQSVVKEFRLPGGWLSGERRAVRAVDGVNLEIQKGEVYGLVGESGCGKTTLGRIILYLVSPTSGKVIFDGQNLTNMKASQLRRLRGRMQIVFQNPLSSLSPRMKVMNIVAEPLRAHKAVQDQEIPGRVLELLQQVGLGTQHMDRFPHEMSGGQCQRVAIARALALNPSLLVLDEPTSALDVSVQAQIINLLQDLQQSHRLTYLFISHDLSVVQHISDRIGVMYLGKLVEVSPAQAIFDNPLHPYTQALISSIPLPDVHRKHKRIVLAGNVPSPLNPPSGCRFHPRCPLSVDICTTEEPPLRMIRSNRQAACHLID